MFTWTTAISWALLKLWSRKVNQWDMGGSRIQFAYAGCLHLSIHSTALYLSLFSFRFCSSLCLLAFALRALFTLKAFIACPKTFCQLLSAWGMEVLSLLRLWCSWTERHYLIISVLMLSLSSLLRCKYLQRVLWCSETALLTAVPLFPLCFRYPSQYVYCSEQSLSGPGQSAQDKDPDSHEPEQDSTQNKVCLSFALLLVLLLSSISFDGRL